MDGIEIKISGSSPLEALAKIGAFGMHCLANEDVCAAAARIFNEAAAKEKAAQLDAAKTPEATPTPTPGTAGATSTATPAPPPCGDRAAGSADLRACANAWSYGSAGDACAACYACAGYCTYPFSECFVWPNGDRFPF